MVRDSGEQLNARNTFSIFQMILQDDHGVSERVFNHICTQLNRFVVDGLIDNDEYKFWLTKVKAVDSRFYTEGTVVGNYLEYFDFHRTEATSG